jgi:hypothetical protein
MHLVEGLPWYQLFNQDFNGVISSAKRGLELQPKLDGIHTNLALGYLYKEEFEEAEKIYNDYKNKVYNDSRRLFVDAFLKDFIDTKPIREKMHKPEINKKVEDIERTLKVEQKLMHKKLRT